MGRIDRGSKLISGEMQMLRRVNWKLLAALFAVGGVGIFATAETYGQATASKPAAAAPAQDLPKAEQLIEKYIAAIGGKDALGKIKSLTATGSIAIPQAGITGAMELMQSDGKMLMVMDMPGVGKQTVGFNGDVAWQESDLTGPQVLEGAMVEDLKFQAKIDGYSDAAAYFDSIETVGQASFAGEDAYKVVAKKKGSPDKTMYFSQQSGLIIGAEGEQDSGFGLMKITTVIGEYKKVGEVLMSHSAEQKLPNGMAVKMTMSKIEANTEVPASKFELPESVKKLIK